MRSETRLLAGPAGAIEVIVDSVESPLGIALVAHPHPHGGGANTNKVAHTLARAFASLGYSAWRPNFRGVGASAGTHDEGEGETDDLLAVLDQARLELGELPVVLAGFSFGAWCQTRVAERLSLTGHPAAGMVLVGTAAGHVEGTRHYDARAVPTDTLVIHGTDDTTVPLANVLAWAGPQDVPVVVIPGADHFFHRRLHIIRDLVVRYWRGLGMPCR